ncbi:hypothetical protein D9619_008915 [Psilocybe cf. subviscida]|uniref:Uncharacterized protein n=1 Tax=Psilocybe cf. subviscida TaxID=2480587 RepID=A0A8H5FA25_9AGAR|nr:hypothetical protein D9619_008915 [Psilocybe cf. subviscida]
MFSSFTAFLPSALHLNAQQELPRPNINPDTEDEDENENEQYAPPLPQSGETEERSGKGKDKSANEVRSPFSFYGALGQSLRWRAAGGTTTTARPSHKGTPCNARPWTTFLVIRPFVYTVHPTGRNRNQIWDEFHFAHTPGRRYNWVPFHSNITPPRVGMWPPAEWLFVIATAITSR